MEQMEQHSKLDPANKDLWVKALRSGTFKQTTGRLVNETSSGYCCLGVYFKEVKGFTPVIYETFFRELLNTSWMGALKDEGLSKKTINHLIEMNDSGENFSTIADWIEANL